MGKGGSFWHLIKFTLEKSFDLPKQVSLTYASSFGVAFLMCWHKSPKRGRLKGKCALGPFLYCFGD